MFQDIPPNSIGTTVLIAVLSSAIGGALSGLAVWWRKSGVDEAKAVLRDENHANELKHFRSETDKMFGKMETLMNGFGQRLDLTTEQQRKLWFTVFGPTETNGIHGNQKELIKDFAAITARVSGVETTTRQLLQDVAQHDQQLHGRGRSDRL